MGSISFIPGKLEGNFAFTLNRNKLSNDPLFRQDDQAIFVSSDLIWHWIAARTNRPGVDVSLSGLWHRVDDDVTPALSITGNQVFLSLIMTLPAASGGL